MRVVEELLIDGSEFDARGEFELEFAPGDDVLALQVEIGQIIGAIVTASLFERSPGVPKVVYRDAATGEIIESPQLDWPSTFQKLVLPSPARERTFLSVDLASGLTPPIAIPRHTRTAPTCHLRLAQSYGSPLGSGWLVGVRLRVARAKEL